MPRLSARTLFRLALWSAAPLALAATGRGDTPPELASPPPAQLAESDAAPMPAPPRLLELPGDILPVALDFVPPVPGRELPPHAPAFPPPAPRELPAIPLELNPHGLSSEAAAPLAAPANPGLRRLPSIEPTPARPGPQEPVASLPVTPAMPPRANAWPTPAPGVDSPPAPPANTFPAPTASARPEGAPPAEVQRGPSPLEAVNQQANGLIQHGAQLADRGAHYSARAQFIQALRLMTQALDVHHDTSDHSLALAEALRALQEADDFAPRGAQLEAHLDIASIVAAHRTPILKGERLDAIAPLTALQRYYAYAQSRFAAACGQEPAAADALYSLGKLTSTMAQRSPDERLLHAPKAMVLHHAAIAANPQHHRAANELGVLLASFGQLEDAKRLFVQSASLAPLPETWHNLAVVHERLGEADLAGKARYEMQLASRERAAPVGRTQIQWVDTAAFARTTPAENVGHAPAPRAAGTPLKTLWK